MTSNIGVDDYVRVYDIAGHAHIGKVFFICKDGIRASISLLSGMGATRRLDQIVKLTDGEVMLMKLENA